MIDPLQEACAVILVRAEYITDRVVKSILRNHFGIQAEAFPPSIERAAAPLHTCRGSLSAIILPAA